MEILFCPRYYVHFFTCGKYLMLFFGIPHHLILSGHRILTVFQSGGFFPKKFLQHISRYDKHQSGDSGRKNLLSHKEMDKYQ